MSENIIGICAILVFIAFGVLCGIVFLFPDLSDKRLEAELKYRGVYDMSQPPEVKYPDAEKFKFTYTVFYAFNGIVPKLEEHRASRSAVVHFVPSEDITKYCGENAIACANEARGQIWIVNPCEYNEEKRGMRVYEGIMCHELGHLNGWRHENPHITLRGGIDFQ